MPDVFLEERVVRVPSQRDRLTRTVVITGAVLVLLAALLLLPALFLLSVGLIAVTIWGARHILKRLNREFEYAFTNGELDVDVIFNKEWRKRLCTVNFGRDVVIMARAGSPELAAAAREVSAWLDAASGDPERETWGIVYRTGGGPLQGLYWTPSGEMVRACRRSAPRVVVVEGP